MKFKKIYIEISDICKLNCSFCTAIKETRGIMNLELFQKAINEAKKHTNLVTFHILGDPLKISNLIKYLDIAYKASLKVELTTSGVFLDDFNILLHPSIKQINFSLDAIVELKNKFELLDRVIDFCKFKIKNDSKIFINLRIQKRARNKDVLEVLQNKFNIEENLKNNLIDENEGRIKIYNKIIIDFRDTFIWKELNTKGYNNQQNNNLKAVNGTCFALDSHIGILSNGIVVPCCIDIGGNIPLGNIANSSIYDILQTKKVKDIKEGFKKNIIIEDLCKICDYRRKFD
ncbi:radical SAM/SPASM domain-containing protein [Helicobacter sp. MIT 14-3879]|uniref:radical SAM/SPASM domain-containing protein n=1 Tax=Helicobacter sp. MIT 14-3879 TaxID=2040649 RepID=UPI000E1E72A6|nr:SPASM domain-containing protein [Helicobacter sp. MIT 14-3879]RDU63131.1 radical SAM protein [Helicobacter sp. MIT 14-3879]